METPNYYEEQAKSSEPEKKKAKKKEKIPHSNNEENFTEVIKGVLTDAGVSVLGGGLASALLGRLSLPIGLLITGYGHHKKNNALRILGIGIIASSSMTNRVENNPKATFVENTTNRIKAFVDELKSKLSFDLLTKQATLKKEAKPAGDLSGVENIQTSELTAPKVNNIETLTPDDSYFESIEKEDFKNAPPVPINEEKFKNTEVQLNKDLEGLFSIKD